MRVSKITWPPPKARAWHPGLVFERFTDRARHVVVYAQEEARMLNHNYIGTEHILLGLIHEGEGVAARALDVMSISLDAARARVEEIIGQGTQPPIGHIPFTPRGKKVLELSLREALQMGHNYIGTEHILLGLVREGEGVGAQVLREMGAELERVRQTVMQLLSGYTASTEEVAGAGSVGTMAEIPVEVIPEGGLKKGPRCARCHALLAETLTVSSLETTVGDDRVEVKVAHCGRCGSALGVLP